MLDAIVIGGGVMGSSAALRLAGGGMRVALFEAGFLGQGASGVNAGTLSLQIKRVALIPYALEGLSLWQRAGRHVGFRQIGGLTLAFTAAEAEMLAERMTARREAGAPIEILTASRASEMEPRITRSITLASYCALDAYANASLTGSYYRELLRDAGVHIYERTAVDRIDLQSAAVVVHAHGQAYSATRALLAAGAWTRAMSEKIRRPLPIAVRVNTVSVTERSPKLLARVLGHATGLLTMKQSANGTILIGGGWQGRGMPETGRGEVATQTLVANLRLAQHALPDLANLRLLRAWTGFEAHTPDYYPLAGLMPGTNNLFVLCCVRGGYTIGPYIGRLIGDLMLHREPERPLFDPARFFTEGAIRA